METAIEVLAYNVRRSRKALHWTQERLAEAAGLSPNYISLIESRKTWPSPEVLRKLARALKTTEPMLFLDPDMSFSLSDLAAVLARMARKKNGG
jgi:transcriptional regulator with XRE-family HTH domain